MKTHFFFFLKIYSFFFFFWHENFIHFFFFNFISPTKKFKQSTHTHTQLGNPTWLGFKFIYMRVSSLKLKGQFSMSLTTRWAMIRTEGLNRPLWIGGKPLTYLKPIIGNDTNCELMGWTLKDFGLNRAYSSSRSSLTRVKGTKEPSGVCANKYRTNLYLD